MSNLFEFVKPIDEELYDYCIEMEGMAKTRPTSSLVELRKAVEHFLEWFLNKTDEEKGLPPRKKKKTFFAYLSEIEEKKLLPQSQLENLNMIRIFGNKVAHPNAFKATVSDLVTEIEKFYEALVSIYQSKNLLQEDFTFDEDKLMIDSYRPIQRLDINSYEEGCEKKYLCVLEKDGSESNTYYVIRQFRKSNEKAPKEVGFWKRDLLTLQRLSEDDLNYIVKNHNITKQDDNELFFTCYELSDSDTNLVDITLKDLTIEERLDIVYQIARGLYGIHTNYEPVYHRALTPSSIYIKKLRSGKRTIRIGNFEYAKLEDVNGVTMVSKVFRRHHDPFRAPELEYGIEINDWAKVDVYSFGMIILFIFNIKGENAFHHVKKLKKFQLSNDFVDLVDRMVDEYSNARPDMKEIKHLIGNEVMTHA
ncbi:protein kinase domain-containing protein [Ornithinibacillus halophilus]|uniref:Protein kinase domain-containing protein n=1 Tax=Ornithinibacillus halophilus TaxID=930117 RepID=A0A1M5GTU9_9BACI|nr:DUF4145 domain-containing protein [Ornithinibacillus halophilus]SHG07139.1 protein of unknown function [Ornithinibacillus halophilus]